MVEEDTWKRLGIQKIQFDKEIREEEISDMTLPQDTGD